MAAKTSEWRPGPTVCRCCLAEGCYKDISTEYFWMGKREVYAEMLSDTLNVSIAYSQSGGPNSNSRLICEPCISRLRDASDFRRQVLECEKTFMNHLDPGSSSVQKEVQLSLEEVKIERVKQEKKGVSDDEDFDDRVDFIVDNDDDDDDLDDEPLMKLATKVPKKEVDLLDLLDSTQITVKRKSTAKTKAPPAKKAKSLPTVKPSASKPSASAPKAEKKKKGPDVIRCSKLDARDNAAIILKYSNVCLFKWLRNKFGCAYCNFSSVEFGAIRKHNVKHWNMADCPFTNYLSKSGFDRVINVEVTNLRCEVCHESMKNISTLVEHLIETHSKPIDKKLGLGVIPCLLSDGFSCADCDKSFDKYINLSSHINEHYPNYTCSQCGNVFSSPHKLRSHVSMIHKDKAQFKCPKCNEVFPTTNLKRKHMSVKHSMFAYKCPYCSDDFKSYHQRVRHINERHDKKINYPCSLCQIKLHSASSRARHVRRIHQKEKLVMCSVCSARFLTNDELKDHMIKHGSGEKTHQCQVCQKAYSRKRTLMCHMRTHT